MDKEERPAVANQVKMHPLLEMTRDKNKGRKKNRSEGPISL